MAANDRSRTVKPGELPTSIRAAPTPPRTKNLSGAFPDLAQERRPNDALAVPGSATAASQGPATTTATTSTHASTVAAARALLNSRDPQLIRSKAEEARAYLEKLERAKQGEAKQDVPTVTSRPDRPGRPENDGPQLEEQRRKILSELMTTEQTYIAGLLSLMRHYLQPLVQKSGRGGPGVRDVRALEAFLGATQCMATLHTKLYMTWETDKSLGAVVGQLSIHVPFLRQYWPYMQGYPLLLLEFTEQASAALAKFLGDVAASQRHLSVAQLLILPVQRIPRYVLLLEAIEKCTPNTHPDLKVLETTLEKVKALAVELNEYQLNCENSTKLFFLHNQIKGLPEDWPILRPSRVLLKDGVMCKAEGDPLAKHPHKYTVRWFLFNVALVITDWNYKYIDRMDLELVAPTERVGGGNFMELLTGLNVDERLPGNTYVFPTASARQEWLTAMLTARYSLINYRVGAAGKVNKRNSVQFSHTERGGGADDESHERLNVYMRIRPFVTENERKDGTVCLSNKGNVVTLQQLGTARADRVATYDYVFGPGDSQSLVFEVVGDECLGAVFAGFNVAILAYGNTGAGKSYTMFGALDKEGNFVVAKPPVLPPMAHIQVGDFGWVLSEDDQSRSIQVTEVLPNGKVKVTFLDTHASAVLEEQEIVRAQRSNSEDSKSSDTRGLVPRMLECLFDVFQNEAEYEAADVSLSYMQLYNDKIQDLLKPESPEISLRLVGHTWVPLGLTETKVKNLAEAMELIRLGNTRRVTRTMRMSEISSRSHAIVGVKVAFTRQGKRTSSSVRFIDLAGAEPMEPEEVTPGNKLDAALRRLRDEERALVKEEAKYINLSLLSLQRVVYALILNEKIPKKERKQVPFKDNKLTWLLMDVLEGEFLCTLILNASPSPVDNQMSLSAKTIAFGEGVKKLDTDRRKGQQTKSSDSFLSSIWASVSKSKR